MTTKPTGPIADHSAELHESNVRDAADSAAWWIGGIVAIVAIVAIVFLVSREPATNAGDLTAAEQVSPSVQTPAIQPVESSVPATAAEAVDSAPKAVAEPAPAPATPPAP